jgi:MYXO-CTERM domain-containing protein
MTASRLIPPAIVFVVALVRPLLAHADVPPACCDFDNVVTCADAGNPCPTGGTCQTVRCDVVFDYGPTMSIAKCVACPVLIDAGVGRDGGGPCNSDPSTFGIPCGSGGTCQYVPAYCGSSTKYACAVGLDWDGQAPPACRPPSDGGVDATPSFDATAGGDASPAGPDATTDASPPGADGGPSVTEDGGTSSGSGGGGCGCTVGPKDASSIVIAWLFAAAVPLALRRSGRKKGRRP